MNNALEVPISPKMKFKRKFNSPSMSPHVPKKCKFNLKQDLSSRNVDQASQPVSERVTMTKIMDAYQEKDSAFLKAELVSAYKDERVIPRLKAVNDNSEDIYKLTLSFLSDSALSISPILYYYYMMRLAMLMSPKTESYVAGRHHKNLYFNDVSQQDKSFFLAGDAGPEKENFQSNLERYYKTRSSHIASDQNNRHYYEVSPPAFIPIASSSPVISLYMMLYAIIKRNVFPIGIHFDAAQDGDGADLTPWGFARHDQAHCFSRFLTSEEAKHLMPLLEIIEKLMTQVESDPSVKQRLIWFTVALFIICHETGGESRKSSLRLESLSDVIMLYYGALEGYESPKLLFGEYISLKGYMPYFVETGFLTKEQSQNIEEKYKSTPMALCSELIYARKNLVTTFCAEIIDSYPHLL